MASHSLPPEPLEAQHARLHVSAAPVPVLGPIPVPVHLFDPSVMKLTRGHSCVLCQQRKVRCDKNKPCANCVKAQVECRVVPPQPPRRRKKKPQERELVDRLKKYEAMLNQAGVTFEPIANDFKSSDPSTIDEVDELQHDLVGLKTSPSSSNQEYSSEHGGQGSDKFKWYPYNQFRPNDDLRDSSDDDLEGSTIHHAFDSMFDSQDGFPFIIGGAMSKVTDSHPPGIQMFQLWQIYLNNVNPLLKVTHTQTLQGQIIEAGANPARISKPLEALLFSVYFIAVTSMSEEDVQNTFDEEKSRLLGKYHRAAQQALVNAGFMRSPDIMVLQAYFLYLISVRQYVDPRSLYCLIGIAVRVAQRLGLHRDGAQFHLPPFEVELRRRLWWQLVAFDKRIAEITGSTITALSSSNGDTKWPLNINDTDLHLHAKDPPAPYVGPTEMLFCLTRIEMCTAAAPEGMRPAPGPFSASADRTRKFHYSPSPSSPDVVTHVANQTLPHDLESYCSYIENTYLKTCDPKIPLHFFTLMMTRQALCKLRVINFLSKSASANGQHLQAQHQHVQQHVGAAQQTLSPGGPVPGPSGGPPAADDPERDALFVEAIRMVEYDNIMQSAESLRGFTWYTYMHFPFPGYMFLVSELRHRRTGDLAERAWAAICENHERRGLIRNPRSPIHVAFGALFVKAWDAREAAEMQLGRTVQAPKFIQLLRQSLPKCDKSSSSRGAANGGRTSSSASAGEPPGSTHGGGPQLGGGGAPRGSHLPDPATAAAMGEMVMDDQPPPPAMMYPGVGGFDGMGHQMLGTGLSEMDFGQMDWSYLMQGGEFGGFPGAFGAMYTPQPGAGGG